MKFSLKEHTEEGYAFSRTYLSLSFGRYVLSLLTIIKEEIPVDISISILSLKYLVKNKNTKCYSKTVKLLYLQSIFEDYLLFRRGKRIPFIKALPELLRGGINVSVGIFLYSLIKVFYTVYEFPVMY